MNHGFVFIRTPPNNNIPHLQPPTITPQHNIILLYSISILINQAQTKRTSPQSPHKRNKKTRIDFNAFPSIAIMYGNLNGGVGQRRVVVGASDFYKHVPREMTEVRYCWRHAGLLSICRCRVMLLSYCHSLSQLVVSSWSHRPTITHTIIQSIHRPQKLE